MMKKAIVYARVSTDEQAEKGYSIPAQINKVTSYCIANNIEVVEIFEEDYSAKDGFDRPTYKKIIAYLKSASIKIDFILFTQWSRFSRHTGASLNEMDRLNKLSIEANAVEQWINHSIPESKYVLHVYLTAPQVENERLALRVKDAVIQGRKEGRYMGRAPYGYDNDKATKLIVANELTSKIVKFCFEKFSEGIYTAEDVRKMGKEKGLKLCKQSFLNMLKNKAYIGKVQVPKHNNLAAYWVDALHNPIVDVSIFEIVQNILDGKRKPYKGNRKQKKLLLLDIYYALNVVGFLQVVALKEMGAFITIIIVKESMGVNMQKGRPH